MDVDRDQDFRGEAVAQCRHSLGSRVRRAEAGRPYTRAAAGACWFLCGGSVQLAGGCGEKLRTGRNQVLLLEGQKHRESKFAALRLPAIQHLSGAPD